jgi:hypothetical protein
MQVGRQRTADMQAGRRIRLACVVLGVFCCLIALLAVWQELESRERSPGAMDYLLMAEAELPADPLGIVSQDIELIGVSDDGKVVGYATKYNATQTMQEIDKAMCAHGWVTLETDAQSIASYVWTGESTGTGEAQGQVEPKRTPGASVLFLCSTRDGGSSVVAELL